MRFMVQLLLRKRVVSSVAIVAAALAVGTLTSPAIRAQAVAAVPYYYYGVGPQGIGYYYTAAPTAQPAPAVAAAPVITMPAQAPASAVGPGVRNWATGNRLPLHRPWLRSR